MKLAAFDLEIYKEVEGTDWDNYWPLGISCAGIKTSKEPQVQLFYRPDYAQMTKADASAILFALETLVRNDYVITTVNGATFDFRVLAEETGQWERCARLAANHVDYLVACVCHFGWRIGLDTLAQGAGHEGKAHTVVLKDGRTITNMDGSMAPKVWKTDPEAVLTYQIGDCDATLAIGATAVRRGLMRWRSKSGKPYHIANTANGLPTVRDCMSWPLPNTSWMDDPPRRTDLIGWINDSLPVPEQITG